MIFVSFIVLLSVLSFKTGRTLGMTINIHSKPPTAWTYSGGLAGSMMTDSLDLSSVTR
jgi:hypothetical protein